jgi:type 1 glutamine amidotransferase
MPAPDTTRVLVVTGGHRVDLTALLALVQSVCDARGWRWEHEEQPAAQRWLRPEHAGTWRAVLGHDLPGLHLRRGEPPAAVGPAAETAQALVALLERGQGLVLTHHALAGWPGWPGWAEALGGRFHYAPGELRGLHWPSSGTRITEYGARVVAPEHPVCRGVEDFRLTDELYCCPMLETEVVPLLRTDADLDRRGFISTYEHVLHGEAAAPDCAGHPPGSDLLAWVRAAANSPLVYVQPGDSGETFALEPYRRLIGNALEWVGSREAHAWARANRNDVPAAVSDR